MLVTKIYMSVSENKKFIVKELIWFKVFGLNLFFILMTYSGFLLRTLCSDNIAGFMETSNVSPSFGEECAGGRYTNYVITLLFDIINFDYFRNQIVIQVFKMVVAALFICALTFIFTEKEKDLKLYVITIDILLLIGMLNVFFVETFIYATPEWGFGLLIVLLAVIFFCKQKYILSFFFTFAAFSQYQVWGIVIGIIIFTYILIDNKCNFEKRTVIAGGKLLTLLALSALLNIFSVKFLCWIGVFQTEVKPVTLTGLHEKIIQIWAIIKLVLKNAYGMMPSYSVFLYVTILLISTIVYLFYKKTRIKKIVFILISMLVILFSSFLIGFLMEEIWLPPRTVFPFFIGIGFSALLVYYLVNENKFLRHLLLFCTSVFLFSSIRNTQISVQDHVISNALDIQYAMEVQEKISEYESNNGINVNRIKFLEHKVRNKTLMYEEFLHHDYQYATYNAKIVYDDWGIVSILEYVSGKDYIRDNMSLAEYNKYFMDSNWNYINLDKQLYFEKDTLYWAVY